ncbi:MAG: glycoside hydrolase family 2 TIM barrel-domain containing protein [Paludibacter sp.]
MSRKKTLTALLLIALTGNIVAGTFTRKTLFDANWRFQKGSITNAEKPEYDDSKWRLLSLPHDWSMEPLDKNEFKDAIGPFSPQSPGGHNTGQTVGGEGWYRKSFTIPADQKDKRQILYFEGSYNQTEIWVNGQKAGYNVYGYTSFRCDITKFCRPAGQPNQIAVKVVNEGVNSRWYSGSGIYRHVWMITTPNAHLDEWETAIRTTELNNQLAKITINALVANEAKNKAPLCVSVQIMSPIGKRVATQTVSVSSNGLDSVPANFDFQIANPQAWSTESPAMYTANISLSDGKKTIDKISIPFGIRTIEFSAEKGFLLNGKMLKMKGGCIHHDNGLLGAAAFDRAEERKIQILKQNGFNAIRLSHNPSSETLLHACDRLGVLVICEAFDQWQEGKRKQDYHLYFDKWSASDIRSLVLRDRNHPSVIMWSVGNEIKERGKEKGIAISEYLRNEIRKYDTTRPVTEGVNRLSKNTEENIDMVEKALTHMDVGGYNYLWKQYEQMHEKYPQRIMFGSETIAGEAAQNWNQVEAHDYVIGDFVWTAMDYIGEAGLGSSMEVDALDNVPQFMEWPWFGAWSGDIDYLGYKKPQSYYRDIVWRQREITMAVEPPVKGNKRRNISFWGWPQEELSWTFPGRENELMAVNVYSRTPKVRLYLNDSLIGDAASSATYKAVFKVPYKAGKLKAVALNGDKEGTAVTLTTTGKLAGLRVITDRKILKADGQDLAFVTIELVDEKGQLILDNNRKVDIAFSGAGQLIASGNASPTDMESFGSLTPKFFNGRAMAIVRAGNRKGESKISVVSEGLKPVFVKIISK